MRRMDQVGVSVGIRMESQEETVRQSLLQPFGAAIRSPFISFYLLYLLGKCLKSLFDFFHLVGRYGRVESEQNDVAKYFAIIPAAFATTYPVLNRLNVMGLASPSSAIMSAVVFNAIIIILLVPLALRGVPYRAVGAARLLRDNLLIYGLGGLLVPFIGIKVIDMFIAACGLA